MKNVFMFVLFCVLYINFVLGIRYHNLQWYKIFLEKTLIEPRLESEIIQSISNVGTTTILQVASSFDWVLLACILSSTELLLMNKRVSPLYKNATEDAYKCFTVLPKDLVFGSVIDGSKIYTWTARNEQNLIKGLYLGDLNQCCKFDVQDSPPWLVVDFGQPKTFQTVSLTSGRHSSLNSYQIKEGKIWIGNSSMSDGDFSNFNLFATFPDFDNGETKVFTSPVQINARYVGIKQNKVEGIFICYWEVY